MTTYTLTAHKDGEESYTMDFWLDLNWHPAIEYFLKHGWSVHVKEDTDEATGKTEAQAQQDGII